MSKHPNDDHPKKAPKASNPTDMEIVSTNPEQVAQVLASPGFQEALREAIATSFYNEEQFTTLSSASSDELEQAMGSDGFREAMAQAIQTVFYADQSKLTVLREADKDQLLDAMATTAFRDALERWNNVNGPTPQCNQSFPL